jgi:hypothetical protein
LPRREGDEEIPMTARSEVRFVDDGVELGAWLYGEILLATMP